MRPNQIYVEDAAGKTVQRVFCDVNDKILMVFSDGTFCLIRGYLCDDETTVENGEFGVEDWWHYRRDLLELGIVRQDEVDKVQSRFDADDKVAKEHRRKAYEALKAEFEREETK